MVIKGTVLIIILILLFGAGVYINAYLRMRKRPPLKLYEERSVQPDFTPLSEIPERLVQLVVVQHGSDEHRIARNLAVNLYFSYKPGFFEMRSARAIARTLEKQLGNECVLELYLNILHFGFSVYGITEASHFYFEKSLDELNLNQTVILACTSMNPVSGNPVCHPDVFVQYRNSMLEACLNEPDPVMTNAEETEIITHGQECLDADLKKNPYTASLADHNPVVNERFGPVKEGIWKNMPYTNSPLVVYSLLSPNHSWMRTHSIDRITPHCAVDHNTAEELGELFSRSAQETSSNYGIGEDGRVGLYVEERNRSWCSSSEANDQRAITIECASEKTDPYAMNEAVYESLIRLCADICKRNGKKKLLWLKDKDVTLAYEPKEDEMILTVHRWFFNKECPGRWLLSRMDDLACKVTELLES